MSSSLCIVIPVLNESKTILQRLDELKKLTDVASIIFVDGNSSDDTAQLLNQHGFKVLTSVSKGRGAQLAYGVSNCNTDCENILFLHIDSQLPCNAVRLIKDALNQSSWGRFDIKLDADQYLFRVIQTMMNLRSKLTNIATGDQSIFVKKDIFLTYANKVAEHPLMEDIYLSKVLKKNHGSAYIISQPIITSTRYWIKNGVIKTILKMWAFRVLYFLGVSPQKLYSMYYR